MKPVQDTAVVHLPRILVVEDEPALRFLITEVLTMDGGFDVVEARSADEAIDMLEIDHDIDCVFTDVRMPGRCDGIALTRHIRDTFPDMKVVVTSGNLTQPERPRDVPFFAKPYDCFAVAACIKGIVTRH